MRREEKSKPDLVEELDLRGVPCPLSWARTKVRLESMTPGQEVTIWLDDPKGARDLPRAAEAEGYAVEALVADGGLWRLRIQV